MLVERKDQFDALKEEIGGRWVNGDKVTESTWETAQLCAGFEIPENCPCCIDNCAFEELWKTCFKVAVRETMIYKRVGPGKRYRSQSASRCCLHHACSRQLDKSSKQRKELPNCLTSCVRGLLHGDGAFAGFQEKENNKDSV